MAYYIYTAPHYAFGKKKNSRPDISPLTAYEITPTTILKHFFHETKHEEAYIRVYYHTIKVNA